MTILIALTTKNRNYLASDTRVISNDDDISTSSKIVEFPTFLVGFAGLVQAKSILHKILNLKKVPKIKDFYTCVKFQELFYAGLKDIDIELLIVTKNGKIFKVDSDCVIEYDNGWACVGSGSSYAKPIVSKMYPSKNALIDGIEAAAKFSASCNNEIAIKEI